MLSTGIPVLNGLVPVLKVHQHWVSSAEPRLSTGIPVLSLSEHWFSSAELLSALGNQCWTCPCSGGVAIQHWLPSAEPAVSTGTECWYTKVTGSALDLPVLGVTSALENQCWKNFSTGLPVLMFLKHWNRVLIHKCHGFCTGFTSGSARELSTGFINNRLMQIDDKIYFLQTIGR